MFIVGRLIFTFLDVVPFPRTTLTDTIIVIFSVHPVPLKMSVGTIRYVGLIIGWVFIPHLGFVKLTLQVLNVTDIILPVNLRSFLLQLSQVQLINLCFLSRRVILVQSLGHVLLLDVGAVINLLTTWFFLQLLPPPPRPVQLPPPRPPCRLSPPSP